MTSKTLRTIRRRLGLTQAAMAAKVAVAPNTIARWERGEIGMKGTSEKLIQILARTTDLTERGDRDDR